jgi:anti-sigma B factor antagonist
MSQTQFCDSAGLNVLVRAHRRAQARGSAVLLVISGDAVLRIFAVTGIDQLIPNFASLEEAMRFLRRTGDSAGAALPRERTRSR